ncbi:hypothetical protein U1Q18_039044 [Sarracenia purpurea var. burkii]
MATSKQRIIEELRIGPFIFVPYSCGSRHEDVVAGVFYCTADVYRHDSTGSIDQIKEIYPRSGSTVVDCSFSKTLCDIYPSLHNFFVYECGVNETPHLRSYLHILLQLSTVALRPHRQLIWFSEFLCNKWVSLHPSFGLVRWRDDEKLKKVFKHFDNIDFLYFGKLSDDEQEMLRAKVSVLMQNLGIAALSEFEDLFSLWGGGCACAVGGEGNKVPVVRS